MKQINTEILKSLNPCPDRYKVWLKHHKKFDGSIIEFLELDKIPAKDKIWVAVRVMPRFLVEVFAIDCAFSASATAAPDAYFAATHAADATFYDADADAAYIAYYASYDASNTTPVNNDVACAERETQIDALIMLLESER